MGSKNTLKSHVQIRRGTFDDLPRIHQLVGELAEYEKASHAFTATLEDYQRDFKKGYFNTLVAVYENEIIGMALFYQTYSTWKGLMYHLEDFIVQSNFRRLGIGQLLFDAFQKEAKHRGARMIKWEVLDWNTPALDFYQKNEAVIEKDWWNGKIIFE